MQLKIKQKIGAILTFLVIVALFIIISQLTQKNFDVLQQFVGEGPFGIIAYIILATIAVVIAPISATPLLPLASNLWGWLFAAIISVLSWTLGALIAFLIARKLGVPIIKKFVPIRKIEKAERLMPTQHIFWSIVFLRIIFPIDILSYAIGLFSKISLRLYTIATLIGLLPFAFAVAYLGKLGWQYQIISLIVAIIIFVIGVIVARERHKIKQKLIEERYKIKEKLIEERYKLKERVSRGRKNIKKRLGKYKKLNRNKY